MSQVRNFREAGFASVLDELEWRGLIAQSTDRQELRTTLESGPTTYYCGFDPTAPSLHIGNLVQLLVMRHLQAAGHRPLALVGGTTGLIGDPRQSGERKLNPKDVVEGWVKQLKTQIGRFLDTEGDNALRFVNNYDWTSTMSVIDFLRDVGKNFRVGTMLSKETVAKRLSSDEGISFAEFSYQVLQGNDYLHLFDEYGCKLQIGGNDQWGNLTSGLDLIRKVRGATVNVMTSPLITDAQGKKFGKSEGGAIWLDPTMLSPYRFYQFWFNQPDDQVVKLLKYFTFLPKDRIGELERLVSDEPGARQAQRVLAWEVTSFVHGEQAAQQAIDASSSLFGRGGDIKEVDEAMLEGALDGLKISAEDGSKEFAHAHNGDRIVDAAVAAGLFRSVSEARKTIASGGVYLNNQRVEDGEAVLGEDDFLHGRFALIRRGKKALGAIERS
ncbi:tyrosine--tRNA ligase [Bifidobacterium psychraerophilum]|jgi:tyrosyl-tRNA synthetase|uniref:Tyrosine--tRNA ligase n=1 Tax=Bifidobacterium psychraerophilum TaxID=218140 RepID=A0A087CH00_9BIFI|nr:tyrosine--tRNA ligase [Bifidobacterium psychraerophilum]KFI82550.1 tyrosyl-tRNA synthetase [Bifidobacterium psychraerophilum]MCI1661111.1 tyrosine--tRNA ligase [Bifidobacterium psychraerophilum]MCI1803968.1 tyrosine--tRNA ligase [Bifidobacterium psychraerophilum]MCI2175734.1 tyrosine--tRNA ligase [Bifidobacterium psychraerophilum]MCI2181740.1 tyrosine--tRNA ligase [Bifidobacterium psychraerophilum]